MTNATKQLKPVRFLWCGIKSPPFGREARIAVGKALQRIQAGDVLPMPISRPMPSIGRRCHELRVADAEQSVTWRVMYRTDDDAILVAEVFGKTTQKTPKQEIELCKKRFATFDKIKKEALK
ncbi:MAG: type II toxin-antitoxin system RelE/ParE family toxin [Kiritimatiellae bacterium]|nr:type II toxin-antitoxin system RelE/ParE family toxin [Kiritimatiellia bacterium]